MMKVAITHKMAAMIHKAFEALLITLLVILIQPRFNVPHFGWLFYGNIALINIYIFLYFKSFCKRKTLHLGLKAQTNLCLQTVVSGRAVGYGFYAITYYSFGYFISRLRESCSCSKILVETCPKEKHV